MSRAPTFPLPPLHRNENNKNPLLGEAFVLGQNISAVCVFTATKPRLVFSIPIIWYFYHHHASSNPFHLLPPKSGGDLNNDASFFFVWLVAPRELV